MQTESASFVRLCTYVPLRHVNPDSKAFEIALNLFLCLVITPQEDADWHPCGVMWRKM